MVTQTRKDVRDSLILAGEECILLHMFHTFTDQDTQERCPVCWNQNLKSTRRERCDRCFGTSFDGGVKEAHRVYGLFDDKPNTETIQKRGEYEPSNHHMQAEAFPTLMQHDHIIRVSNWGSNHKVLNVEGIYRVEEVHPNSIRTGTRFGGTSYDVVGQRAECNRLSSNSAIYLYLPQVIGQSFPEFHLEIDQQAPVVVQPDEKVLYFPIPAPPPPIVGTEGFVWTQTTPASVWIIPNPLGHYPSSITLLIDGEVVETDEDFPDIHTITLTFPEPMVGVASIS